MEELPITSGFYISDVLPLSHQECTNYHIIETGMAALSAEQVRGTPGIELLATSGVNSNINRGADVKGGTPYFVNGTGLYSLDTDNVLTYLGFVEGIGRVSMAHSNSELMILVPGGKGYIYNEAVSPAFAEITDSDFTANGNPQYVVYIDGYFAATTDTKKWIVSNLNQGLLWDALDFGSAEADPDNIIAPVVANNQIYILGETTTEGFQNIGGSGFPFQRNNVFLDKGCTAPSTLISTNSTFYMVGKGAREGVAIWKLDSNQFVKVSPKAIDKHMQTYTELELLSAFAWSYSQDGIYFVGFSFPDRAFVLNTGNGKWHERKSLRDEELIRWRPNSVVAAYEQILVGDSIDGRIGALTPTTYLEYGEEIISIMSTMPFANKGNELVCTILELTVESGIGNSDVENPQVSMAISRDGKTWSQERSRSMGRIGDYGRRVIWRKNGRYPRFVVLRFRISDPIRKTIIKLEFE